MPETRQPSCQLFHAVPLTAPFARVGTNQATVSRCLERVWKPDHEIDFMAGGSFTSWEAQSHTRSYVLVVELGHESAVQYVFDRDFYWMQNAALEKHRVVNETLPWEKDRDPQMARMAHCWTATATCPTSSMIYDEHWPDGDPADNDDWFSDSNAHSNMEWVIEQATGNNITDVITNTKVWKRWMTKRRRRR